MVSSGSDQVVVIYLIRFSLRDNGRLFYLTQTNLLKDIKTYLKAAANRETELMKKQQELEEKVCD